VVEAEGMSEVVALIGEGPDIVWGKSVGKLVDPAEIRALAAAYGTPRQLLYRLQVDDFLFYTRFQKSSDRRGEVGFVLRCGENAYLLHTKDFYPGVYRLPTGGIYWREPVDDALVREVREETSLTIHNTRFLAVLGYEFHYRTRVLPFVTYLFYAERAGGELWADGVEVAGFREVPLAVFSQEARRLQALPAPRTMWGIWRALAHQVAYELLSQPA
jgi:ADP-ribose pyrophosphatase YjhB (NUDIX family)